MSTPHNEHGAGDGDSNEDDVQQAIALGEDLIQSIFSLAPLDAIKQKVLDGAPLWYQDNEGTSALHAAAYVSNAPLVRFLIEQGAIWNAVDNLHNSAGDIALSLNDETSYLTIRDAGIRSELILTLLASKPTPTSPLSLVLKATDNTAFADQDTFLASRLRFTKDKYGQDICLLQLDDENSQIDGKGAQVGVMMGWERGIMKETVHKLCADHPNLSQGLSILNIGFGLGIIDTFFQSISTPPTTHVIIEPHPDVLAHMRATGWFTRPGVHILEGRWQDFIGPDAPRSEELLALVPTGFDVIYTDTFSEEYKDLQEFFDHLPDLLSGPDARFSFFNGLGATNALFYDVYTHVSELHLADAGLDIVWSDVDVFPSLAPHASSVGRSGEGKDGERWGATKEYFGVRTYRLPIAQMQTI